MLHAGQDPSQNSAAALQMMQRAGQDTIAVPEGWDSEEWAKLVANLRLILNGAKSTPAAYSVLLPLLEEVRCNTAKRKVLPANAPIYQHGSNYNAHA